MIATTIKQSKHLLELGLDPKTADCNWNTTFGERSLCIGKNKLPHAVPAWSLSALLEVMPKELEVGLFKTPISGEYFFSLWTDDHHMGDDYKEPIDAAYEMVCWLLEQGLIKKGDNDEND